METATPTVLMMSSEATPWAKTGGLADVVGALPLALQRLGVNAAVVMPRYRSIDPRRLRLIVPRLPVVLNSATALCARVYSSVDRGLTYYFIECDDLYEREGLYSAGGKDFDDNYLRFAAFSLAGIELARLLETPEIIHCHDWQTALVATYLKTRRANMSTLSSIKTLFTIHNMGYQGLFGPDILADIGLSDDLFTPRQLEFFGRVNLLKGGLVFADRLTTVSSKYAEEIQTPELGFGLDGVLRERSRVLSGILNGVDYSLWDPGTDVHITVNYGPRDVETGKAACKRALLAEVGLGNSDASRPLVGVVSRFDSQKGFDLIQQVARDFASLGCTLVALGAGNRQYEDFFRAWAAERPTEVAVRVGFDNGLAHRIEAGADIFLMPSRYEPCGLNQMFSLRYGTVPVVRATGGLDDVVDKSTGFKFQEYTGHAMLSALREAVTLFRHDRVAWQAMMLRGMAKDFSWDRSAAAYAKVYAELTQPAVPA